MKLNEPRNLIQAIVFAEGGSPRLRPLTEHLPTSLVPVGGTPILDHQIQVLFRMNLKSLTVVGGYRAIQVEQACRNYGGILFRVNPRFSRGEPQRNSLTAAAPEAGAPVLLVRGDLVFDGTLVDMILSSDAPDALVVGPTGRGIGLYLVSAGTLQELLLAAPTASSGEPELFPWVESVLASKQAQALSAGDVPWARVSSLEDLARALKAGRDSRAARVARAEQTLAAQAAKDPAVSGTSAPPESGAQPPSAPRPDEGSGLGNATQLTRSLLRVFPR